MAQDRDMMVGLLMETTCPKCKADFEVEQDIIPQDRTPGRCPFCQTKYALLSEELANGGPRVVFDQGRVQTRTCIQCSKDFETIEQDAVPVCPECKGETKKDVVRARSRWKLIRSGEHLDFDSEASIRESIAQGEIRGTDILISPDDVRKAANAHTPFAASFRSQLARKDRSRPGAPMISRRYRTGRFFGKTLLLLVLGFSLAWVAYRYWSFPETINESENVLRMLANNYALEVEAPTQDLPQLLEEAYGQIALDRQDSYRKALVTLKQIMVIQPDLPETLGRIAEIDALISAFGTDHKTRLKALELADLAIRLFPQRPEGYVAKVRAALSADNFESAAQALELAKTKTPEIPRLKLAETAFLLASTEDSEKLASAIHILAPILQNTPSLLETYDLIGQAHIKLREPAQASTAFEQRLALSTNDPQSLYRMGQLAERANNPSAAKEWHQRALRESPYIVGARLNLAIIYSRVEDNLELAQKHLWAILKRYREYATTEQIFAAQRELVHVLVQQGKTKSLGSLLADLPLILSDTSQFVQTKAEILMNIGKAVQAITLLQDFLVANSDEYELHETLGRALALEKNWDLATKAFREAIKLDASRLSSYLHLTSILVQNLQFDEALDVANAAFSRAGTTEADLFYTTPMNLPSPLPWSSLVAQFEELVKKRPLAAISHGILGLTHLRKGISHGNRPDIDRALTRLRKARSLDKGLELAHFYIGRGHFDLENWSSAQTALRAAISVNPISSISRFWLGQALFQAKRYDEAERIFTMLQQDSTLAFRAKTNSGLVAFVRDKPDEAEALWKESLELRPLYRPTWKAILEHQL